MSIAVCALMDPICKERRIQKPGVEIDKTPVLLSEGYK